jgi:hypothetical protein
MHGGDNMQLGEVVVSDLFDRETPGYYTDGLTACIQYGICNSPHHTNGGTAVYQPDVPLTQYLGKVCCGMGISRKLTRAGTTINADFLDFHSNSVVCIIGKTGE